MKESLSILLIGKGGRESALAAKILQSPRCRKLYSTPAQIEGAENVEIPALDFESLDSFIRSHEIDMVVVGPEAPIVKGIYDALCDTGAKIIAPDKECARLEGSKEFAKEFMIRHAIPSPRFMSVTSETLEEGLSYLDSMEPPYVVKADGLAAGRGVLITDSLSEAKENVMEMLSGLFGHSSETVIIEEFVRGRECSFFFAVDGEDYIMLPSARDYKRFGVGGTGLNTAGLGAVSPAAADNDEFEKKVEKRILIPTLRGLKEEGLDYCGFLYIGMAECDGEPVVFEYNVRLGDPETQVIMPRIESDFIDLLEGIADRTLALKKLTVSPLTAVGVVLAAKGYPGRPVKGDIVYGVDSVRAEGDLVFEGAVERMPNGQITTDGGRIATVVALAETRSEATHRALKGAEMIHFEGKYYRSDIGSRL